VEHEDCGAYREFLKEGKFSNRADEIEHHALFATTLAPELQKAMYDLYKAHKENKKEEVKDEPADFNVHCFFIDLRGNVELIHTTTQHS
jgi:hypothetical protein